MVQTVSQQQHTQPQLEALVEFTVILPLVDNDGQSLAMEVQAITSEIIAIAHGFSQWIQQGVWHNAQGVELSNQSLRVVTTVSQEQASCLFSLAPHWKEQLRQEALFVQQSRVYTCFV